MSYSSDGTPLKLKTVFSGKGRVASHVQYRAGFEAQEYLVQQAYYKYVDALGGNIRVLCSGIYYL